MKNPLCYLRIHQWEYKREKHPVKNHPTQRDNIYVKIRECNGCGKREHHMLPTRNGRHFSWRKCKFGPNDTITFQRVES